MNLIARRGFTLIELLTVLAISSILFGIIMIPVVQGFNLTRAAQAFSEAQDRARSLIEQIGREISNSAGVRDNSGVGGRLAIVVPGQDTNPEAVVLEYVKLDIVRPAQGDPTQRGSSGAFINPDTGKEDPTLRQPKGQVALPVAPGASLVRYFVGLRRPLAANTDIAASYNNPYDGILMARNSLADNLYVLYRAEVQPKVWDPVQSRYVTNVALFEPDPQNGEPILDDPFFFVADGTAAKAARIRQWQRAATIITEISRYDMIQTVFERRTRRPIYDGNVPRILPLVQFRPTRQSSEPLDGLTALRSGEEVANSDKVGPDVFTSRLGGWTSVVLRMWPSTFDSTAPWAQFLPWQAGNSYLVTRVRMDNNGNELGTSAFAYDNTGDEMRDGTEVFDVDEYLRARNADPADPAPPGTPLFKYPFSHAVEQANLRSGWLGNPALRDLFVAHVPDRRQGKILASFAITEVGDGNPAPGQDNDNRPVLATGGAYTPGNDPGLPGNWNDLAYRPSSMTSTINQRFNKLWREWDQILLSERSDNTRAPDMIAKEAYCKRFIDLRFAECWDGASSPLHPTAGFLRARIVPGSEVVIAPDQRPGANYGRYVRYTRVTQGRPGINQYRINYVPIREPDWTELNLRTPNNPYDPRTYDPTGFVSSILQPQFRAGYLEFNSDAGTPLPNGYIDPNGNPVPTGNVSVFYRFQFTEPKDVVAADYDSRQVLEIALTIKNFPQSNVLNAQTVTLNGRSTVRNFIR